MPRSPWTVPTTVSDTSIRLAGRLTSRSVFAAAWSAVLLLGNFASPIAQAQEATPATPATAVVESAAMSPVEAATGWLRVQQELSGGFPGFSGEVDPGTTTDAVIALHAAQESDPAAAGSLAAALAYLEKSGTSYAETGPGQAAKLALAAVAGGRDPRSFAGLDLVAAMIAPLATPVPDGIASMYGDDLYDHALVLIALAASGETISDAAIEPLRATQGADGGWAFNGAAEAGAADSNTTALVIQALAASGHGDDPMIERALPFLTSLLAPDGSGFAYGPADPLFADANSTALVIQALIAVGEDPSSPTWGNAPMALARFQTPSGGLRYLASDEEPNLLATLQAIPAMAGIPLPVAVGCATDEDTGGDGCIPLALAA